MRLMYVLVALFSLIVSAATCRATDESVESDIWNIEQLSRAPGFQWIDQQSPIRSLTYEGELFEGRATRVFAFYATPGTLTQQPDKDRSLPAVVLIHGGGGTAFAEWVHMWAKRGYAAIAMDLGGNRPEAPAWNGQNVKFARGGGKRTRLPDGGPEQGSPQKFGSIADDTSSHWPYHAIANVVRAHSLIRSFPETDPERTALTGISWGGYTTCIAASVDHRFKAAVPVYGCGFLYDGESVQRAAIDALTANQRNKWIERYDPSSHLSRCSVPVLFVNGTNDKHYPLQSYSRSIQLVPKTSRTIRITVNMRHSHQAGWQPKEIFRFIDSHIGSSPPLPTLEIVDSQSGTCSATYTASAPLKSASVHYTTDAGPLLKRNWQTMSASIDTQTISAAAVPANATIWFMTVTDSLGDITSTNVVFGGASAHRE